MMDSEEFLRFIKSSKEKIDAARRKEEAFITHLREDLFDLTLRVCYDTEDTCHELVALLSDVAEKYAKVVLEAYGHAVFYLGREELILSMPGVVPAPLSNKDLEQRISKLREELPGLSRAEWREIVIEDFEEDLKDDWFRHEVHRTMKQALTDYYIDDILRFDAVHFLLLDERLFVLGANLFVDEVYTISDKSILQS